MDLARFSLSTEESEVLMLFEELQDVVTISKKVGRDPSGVSRMIKRLAEKHPVLEKRGGRWQITPLGAELNNVNRNFVHAQASILKTQMRLRIGTNREFAARVLAPGLGEIQKSLKDVRLDILSYESGVESALKNGLIDVGFDCDAPADPDVAYKLIVTEPIEPFCSKSFAKKYRTQISAEDWPNLPHILCERLYPNRLMNIAERDWNIVSNVNDIAIARELAKSGAGWALLPSYSVQREVTNGELVMMGDSGAAELKYGVWWLRDRKHLAPVVSVLMAWLKNVDLGV